MSEFRVTMKDRDGNLIMDRKTSDSSFYFVARNKPDRVFIEYTLKVDCRERGVRLVRYDVDNDGIHALVDYL